MVGLFSILALGFFLGMRHATDPDHVIAVSTIVARQQKLSRAALTGIVWGLGHTLTITVVGIAIILFGLVIPPRLGLGMELSVGFMLIVLGSMNVSAFLRDARPHPPEHASLTRLDRWFGDLGLYQQLRPLVVGVVHGLAGSAAVALLVLTTLRDTRWAITYLLLFGVGTIAGMMLITMSLASAIHFVGSGRAHFSRRLSLASGVLSLAFGLLLAYQVCFVNGLLTAHPHWTPQ